MSRKLRQRRLAIIGELARLSRSGWQHASPADYEPLEAELRAINTQLNDPPPRGVIVNGRHVEVLDEKTTPDEAARDNLPCSHPDFYPPHLGGKAEHWNKLKGES